MEVVSEVQLRQVVEQATSSWSGALVVQLAASLELTRTLVISTPVVVQGRCEGGSRCVLKWGSAASSSDGGLVSPMVLVTGPAAAVQVEDVLLQGATNGALLVANFSQVSQPCVATMWQMHVQEACAKVLKECQAVRPGGFHIQATGGSGAQSIPSADKKGTSAWPSAQSHERYCNSPAVF